VSGDTSGVLTGTFGGIAVEPHGRDTISVNMANPKHLEILKQGAKAWNEWRDSIHVTPSLEYAQLAGADLPGVDLSEAELRGASLSGANLSQARLPLANLTGATLREADLQGAYLVCAGLCGADLRGANLAGAQLGGADLDRADLSKANLSGTKLDGTGLVWADLTGANLDGADFGPEDLGGGELAETAIGWTRLEDIDLSKTKGLEAVLHVGPSTIGIDTLYKSRGQIPEAFLLGAGVPRPFITNMKALVGSMDRTQFYSCFISHSSKDKPFAKRLYGDLQNKGVRCFFAPEDLKIGAKARLSIDESIRAHDKLLLILSKHSIQSEWVEQEVETALAKERQQNCTVLVPIRLDQTVMKMETGWPAFIRNSRNIGDFRRWKDHNRYKDMFERLLRALQEE
jgi:uncharacterized protein YjbI with pentapeptide repeats